MIVIDEVMNIIKLPVYKSKYENQDSENQNNIDLKNNI